MRLLDDFTTLRYLLSSNMPALLPSAALAEIDYQLILLSNTHSCCAESFNIIKNDDGLTATLGNNNFQLGHNKFLRVNGINKCHIYALVLWQRIVYVFFKCPNYKVEPVYLFVTSSFSCSSAQTSFRLRTSIKFPSPLDSIPARKYIPEIPECGTELYYDVWSAFLYQEGIEVSHRSWPSPYVIRHPGSDRGHCCLHILPRAVGGLGYLFVVQAFLYFCCKYFFVA